MHGAGADDEPGDDDGENAGRVEMFGGEERGERHHESLHGFQRGVAQVAAYPQRQQAEDDADDRPEDGVVAEEQQGVLDEGVGVGDLRDGDREQ